MTGLRYTLLGDGSSDRVLMRVLAWLLRQHGVTGELLPQWANLDVATPKPRRLHERISSALRIYPCELLFVHRDAEKDSHRTRRQQICDDLDALAASTTLPSAVCVVPVRMTEAWFLFREAESAVRAAAGNPQGRVALHFPRKAAIESLSDPKQKIQELLETASEKPARRLKDFRHGERFIRMAGLIDDFSPLRGIPAFDALEVELAQTIRAQGWSQQSKEAQG